MVISNGLEPALERVLSEGCWTPVERFGVPLGWRAEGEDDQRFAVSFSGSALGEVRWDLLGEHNRMNALAAIAAACHAGVTPAQAIAALARFQNVRRRLEVRGVAGGVTVYDDFAHHPTAIVTTIGGLRRKVGGSRILAVLEPRSNTMKLGVMKDRLPESLAGADRVYCYTQGLGWDPRATLAPLGAKASCVEDLDTLVSAVSAEARAGDHVLVMSNGGFGGIHAKLLERLATRVGQ
jgi:UDP-N-acetylmuramate: L-alanyl-gamma-D-glutamyl-meso-diaminopimelate ligase